MAAVVILVGPSFHLVTGQPQSAETTRGAQEIKCQFDNQWYPAGSIINMGRSENWCYGAYCRNDGQVRYWDDLNCPMPTANNPTPQIPIHIQNEIKRMFNPQQSQQQINPAIPVEQQQTLFGTPMFGSKPLFPPEQITPPPAPTTEANFFNMQGCWYRDRFFWPGTDIYNRRNGFRCMGAYCDWKATVQHWEDSCGATLPPPPRRPIDRT